MRLLRAPDRIESATAFLGRMIFMNVRGKQLEM
jgi:hypothetical protein